MSADQATADAFQDPKPGDRFHEMYSFWFYVLDVQPDGGPVTVMEVSPPCTVPRDGKIRVFECVHKFREHYSYEEKVGSYWMRLAERDNDVAGWLESKTAELGARS